MKLIDFGCDMKFGEPMHGGTAEYMAPEVCDTTNTKT